jgi:hypothetical protein
MFALVLVLAVPVSTTDALTPTTLTADAAANADEAPRTRPATTAEIPETETMLYFFIVLN